MTEPFILIPATSHSLLCVLSAQRTDEVQSASQPASRQILEMESWCLRSADNCFNFYDDFTGKALVSFYHLVDFIDFLEMCSGSLSKVWRW